MKGLIGQSDVHDFAYALRVNTGADIVVAITQLMGGAFGIAGGVPGPAGLEVQESVAIVRLDATGPGKLTGPHELAHLVGASHSSTNGETYAKDYAFLYYTEIYGTLMNPLGSHDYRIKFLSGPNVKFPATLPPNQQVTAGNATHDNARAVDKWDDEVGDLKLGMYCKYFGVGHEEFAREMLASLTGKPGVTASDVQSYTTELSQAFRDQLVPYSARHAVIEMIESDEAGKIKELVRLYHMMLNRAPDYPGLEYWLGQRWSGLSINAVADAFATSPEFVVKHGSQADSVYVDSLYQEAFGFNADPAGNAYWVGQIAAHSRAWVAVSLSNWPAAKVRNEGVARYQTLVFGVLNRTNSDWFEDRHGYKMVLEERFTVARWHLDSTSHHTTCS